MQGWKILPPEFVGKKATQGILRKNIFSFLPLFHFLLKTSAFSRGEELFPLPRKGEYFVRNPPSARAFEEEKEI
jgi:hypothetical protein